MAEPEPVSEQQAAFMERVRWVEHQGRKILFTDFSNIRDPNVVYPLIHKNRTLVAQQAPNSVLTMTLVSNSRFDARVIAALNQLVRDNKPRVKAAVIVGLTGLQKVVYVTLTQLSGRRIQTYATVEEAKEWLVAQ